jgi:hypothetical protein
LVPVVLSMSAAPASAMPKSCLTMHVAWEQATLESTRADATMTSFQDNVVWYADSDGFYREKGWFFTFTGSMEWYDLDPGTWNRWNSIQIENAQFYEDQAEAAYNDMVGECGW